MTVTHEQLHADIATLRAEVASIREGDARHNSEIIAINGKLSAGGARFAELSAQIGTLSAGMTKLEAKIDRLNESDALRRGRDGVWAAIVRSPLVGWLTAAGATIAGIFGWLGKGN